MNEQGCASQDVITFSNIWPGSQSCWGQFWSSLLTDQTKHQAPWTPCEVWWVQLHYSCLPSYSQTKPTKLISRATWQLSVYSKSTCKVLDQLAMQKDLVSLVPSTTQRWFSPVSSTLCLINTEICKKCIITILAFKTSSVEKWSIIRASDSPCQRMIDGQMTRLGCWQLMKHTLMRNLLTEMEGILCNLVTH